ncbi:MAG: FAD-binding domain-containing protein [Pseudomonadota bacterium]
MPDDGFPPTLAAAQQRIAAIDPTAYARSRNHLGGAVTRLSPYLTHGIVSLTEVAAGVAARHPLALTHKLVQELAWRAFFHHVARRRGDGILQSLHAGPRPEADYQPLLPDDVRQARSGVPVIDQAVRALYTTGWLHNHARMWLASYLVHVRGVHWRAGADWMLAHLLDGDRASNHLSWQWVAGTGSHKPYLFNAENVARHCAGTHDGWASPGSVLDTSYTTLERWAHGQTPLPLAAPLAPDQGLPEPLLWRQPPPGLPAPAALPAATTLAGRTVQLLHPWALAEPAAAAVAGADPGVLRLGVWPAEHFQQAPWTARRWAFVAQRLAAISTAVVWADGASLQQALQPAARVLTTDHPELPASWPAAWRQSAAPLLPEPAQLCGSFSQFWRQATRGIGQLDALPGWPLARQQPLF